MNWDLEEGKMEGRAQSDGTEEKSNMASPDLNGLCTHLNTKISNIKKSLQLRKIGQEPSLKTVLGKIVHELLLVNKLLNQLEMESHHQERQQNQLKELQESLDRDYLEVQHLRDNMPIHLPKAVQNSEMGFTLKNEEQRKDAEVAHAKKPAKKAKCIKEVTYITAEEFERIPAYMRGRLAYNQVNAVIQEINKAVVSKYKIMHQPTRTMSSAIKNLYFRFQEEETKDTKGEFFIVEADIEEFTQMKADKRFHSILTILRHCQRVREIRGSRLVRYAVC
ncbi:spindle and kinetochore-associated protein 1 isoform X2 [Sceloporus undulatus]|uniref:spindle and kinetochore-associated protein 1 isoform X2 n=1 Tax=Sceloporus undulatus TaxID=8520 RepID=UPI001C4B2AD6|nr:spindle and kinetochore-associated protein 1 isoform X2 [Sceloporus undulatus]